MERVHLGWPGRWIRVLGRTGMLYVWWLVQSLRRGGGLERLLCFYAMQRWSRAVVMLCAMRRCSLCLRYAEVLAMLCAMQRCSQCFALCRGARYALRCAAVLARLCAMQRWSRAISAFALCLCGDLEQGPMHLCQLIREVSKEPRVKVEAKVKVSKTTGTTSGHHGS